MRTYYKRSKGLLLSILLMLIQSLSFANNNASIIEHFIATYDIRYHSMVVGKITRIFNTRPNGEFNLVNRTQPLLPFFKLDINERATGTLSDKIVEPHNYLRRFAKDNDQRTASLRFNWQKRTVFYQQGGNHEPLLQKYIPLNNKVYDPLSYHIAIKKDLAAGKKLLSYRIADKGKLKLYRFQVIDSKQIETTLGPLDTVIVEQIGTSSRKSKFWLAKNKNYLLVRYEQQRNNQPYLDIRIHSFQEGV